MNRADTLTVDSHTSRMNGGAPMSALYGRGVPAFIQREALGDEAWHAERQRFLGASEVAAGDLICISTVEVFREKMAVTLDASGETE